MLSWAQQALAIARTRAANQPGSAHFADQLATSHQDVSAAAGELAQHELAVEHAADALAMREKLYQADRTNPGRQATFVYARATLAESQAKHSDDSGARATLTKAQIVLSQLKPELRDQLDMISAEMGINGVSARLDGRAAASNGNAASRVALCQSAETALQRVRMRQPQWEEFHKQSLQPEIDEIRAEMKGCVR